MRAGGAAEEKRALGCASKVRWDERQRLKVAQEERANRNVQEAVHEVDHNWTAACEGIAMKMLKYLEDSEVMKVSTRELKEQVLSPDESSVKKVRMRGRKEVRKATSCFRFSDNGRTRSSSQVRRGGRSNCEGWWCWRGIAWCSGRKWSVQVKGKKFWLF